MEVIKSNCPSCGAPLYIEEDMTMVKCQACGSSLSIERSQGEVTLKFIEKIAAAIQQAGNATQDAIRETSYVTRTELQRLQANQTLSTLRLQLSNLQAEMRAVQRNSQTQATTKQLQSLHQSEYHLYEQMLALYKQISQPDPNDLQARIDSLKGEMTYIDAEVASLTASDHPNRSGLLYSLKAQKTQVNSTILGLQIQALRKRFTSFGEADPTTADPSVIAALLDKVNADELAARQFRSTPEGNAVYNELASRQKKLASWLTQIDQKRIGELLQSTKYQGNPNDLNSLNTLLNLINQDLSLDFRQFEPGVVQSFQRGLLARKDQTQKQIKKLEKRMNAGHEPGLFAGIAAAFAGLFGGNSAKPTQAQVQAISMPHADLVAPTATTESAPAIPAPTSGINAMPVSMPTRSGSFLTAGVGCGVWLAAFVIVSFIGAFILSLLFGTTENKSASGGMMALLFLFLTAGFLLGSFLFIKIAIPRITIKGFGPLPTIVVNRGRFGQGIQKSGIVKVIFGLIVLVALALIFSAFWTLATDFSTSLGAVLLLLGVLVAPVMAILTAVRTTISNPD
jgi:uncharacterized Zn finger protein (UPF0148 family)